MRGGEKVLEALCELYPDADLYTHVYDPEAVSPTIRRHLIRTTLIDKLPRAKRMYQSYLPLMPFALEQLDLRAYDLVISSESGPAKGVLTLPETLHVCYCHTPMRYLWSMYQDYLSETSGLKKLMFRLLAGGLRRWDLAAAARVDRYIANSTAVAGRISKYYRREAAVIFPPVDVAAFKTAPAEDFYLVLGQLVSYKRADMAVEAFTRMGKRLVVIGEGEQLDHLKRIAGPTVEVMGGQPFDVVKDRIARCKALVFPGEEDFGIVPLEAMAAGKPVIAYAKGGALDTVIDGKTGLHVHDQTVDGFVQAVERLEAAPEMFDPDVLRAHAEGFGRDRFKTEVRTFIEDAWSRHRASLRGGTIPLR
ncbi:MAG: glycosyltransferase [Alphaproteobacteria bacterium]|nr:glycosyltransferase [Alphaproteobacteria bacterium]